MIGDPEPVAARRHNPATTIATAYGNAGVGILQGPGQFNFDLALLKNTRITENKFVQFRAEFSICLITRSSPTRPHLRAAR